MGRRGLGTVGAMTRTCARPGCGQPADATLTYDYRAQVAWLDPLSAEPHPMTHDLCDDHAERTTVPRGWRLEHRRGPRGVVPLAS